MADAYIRLVNNSRITVWRVTFTMCFHSLSEYIINVVCRVAMLNVTGCKDLKLRSVSGDTAMGRILLCKA
jgi:hypothetical protein